MAPTLLTMSTRELDRCELMRRIQERRLTQSQHHGKPVGAALAFAQDKQTERDARLKRSHPNEFKRKQRRAAVQSAKVIRSKA